MRLKLFSLRTKRITTKPEGASLQNRPLLGPHPPLVLEPTQEPIILLGAARKTAIPSAKNKRWIMWKRPEMKQSHSTVTNSFLPKSPVDKILSLVLTAGAFADLAVLTISFLAYQLRPDVALVGIIGGAAGGTGLFLVKIWKNKTDKREQEEINPS
ncbi:hypothetical protein HYT84_00370 [Candidatus Micrarchaeota archaeon]|nr:hypothetical protein [Candidatus Micrarchaeota archaeon]